MSQANAPYSQIYIAACEIVEALAIELLGRSLTEAEQRGIWNAGSLKVLESVERNITECTLDAVAMRLVSIGASFDERLSAAHTQMIGALEEALGRPLSDSEKSSITRIKRIHQLMEIGERLRDGPPDNRSDIARHILDEHSHD